MPDPKYSLISGKDAARRTTKKDIISMHPGLEYASGKWGGKDPVLFKYKDEAGKEYGYKYVTNPDGTTELISTGPLAKPSVTAPTIAPKTMPTNEKKPVVVNPIVNEQPRKSLIFGQSGYTDPNTGETFSYDAKFKEKVIEPNVQNYKTGGLVGKIKGYSNGTGAAGTRSNSSGGGSGAEGYQEAIAKYGAVAQGGLEMGADITDAVGLDPEKGRYKGYGSAITSGAMKGAAKGAAIDIATGGATMGLGAATGAVVGGTMGGIRQKKALTAEEQAEAEAIRLEQERLSTERYMSNLNKQMQSRMAGYKDGGKIEGPGTAKSDSILAKVKPGSFVVPAENADKAEAIRQSMFKGGKVTKAPSLKKKANLNQEDGELVRLSNGEHLFTPEERKKIIADLGEEVLEMLAPNAEDSEEGGYAKGGLTSSKAKTILRDGSVHGKALTDKQKRFFGAIAGGQSVKEYMCGGKVKGYAEGGETGDDEELKRIAKREKEIAEKEKASKEKLEKEKKVAEKRASAYDKTLSLLELRNEKKSELQNKLSKLERELKAKESAYETYKKQQDALRDRKTTGGVRAQTGLYDEKKRLAKEKELATEIKKMRDELDLSSKQYKYVTNESNFNPDGTVKSEAAKKEGSKIFITTGENAEKATGQDDFYKKLAEASAPAKGNFINKETTGKGGLTAPKIKSAEKMGVAFKAPVSDESDIMPPAQKATEKPLTDQEKQLVKTAQEADKNFVADTQKKPDYLKTGLQVADELRGLGNFVLPYKQYGLGRDFLARAGKRPVDKIDPGFQEAVDRAQVNAKFGFTPEEQAMIDQQNLAALNTQRDAARMFSGGSAANALANTRSAASDYFSRGLASAVKNKQLQLSKQQQADDLSAQKAAMSRNLFMDNLNAWQQQQAAGAELMGAGLKNLIGAKRLNDEMAFNRQYAQGENAWHKTIGQ